MGAELGQGAEKGVQSWGREREQGRCVTGELETAASGFATWFCQLDFFCAFSSLRDFQTLRVIAYIPCLMLLCGIQSLCDILCSRSFSITSAICLNRRVPFLGSYPEDPGPGAPSRALGACLLEPILVTST